MDQRDVQRNAVFPDMVGISVKHCFILHPVLERHVSQPCTHNSALFTGRLSLILYAADEAIAGGGGGRCGCFCIVQFHYRSEEHTSELQSLMRTSYAVFCLKKQKQTIHLNTQHAYA